MAANRRGGKTVAAREREAATQAAPDEVHDPALDVPPVVGEPLDPGPAPEHKRTERVLRVSDPFTSRFVYGDGEDDFLDNTWRTVPKGQADGIIEVAGRLGVEIEEGTD